MLPRKLIMVGLTLLLLNVSFLSFRGYSQSSLSPINRKIDSLQNAGIDTILRYPLFFAGRSQFKGSFHLMDADYLIWRDKKGCFIQKFSSCLSEDGSRPFDTAFTPIYLENDQAYVFFIEKLDTVKVQYLRPALVKQKWNGKDTIIEETPGYHSPRKGIEFLIGTKNFKNYYYDSQVWDGTIRNDDGSFRYKYETLNYDYNISTAIVRLVKLLDLTVRRLEDNKAFGH